jgi:hypothetical protein
MPKEDFREALEEQPIRLRSSLYHIVNRGCTQIYKPCVYRRPCCGCVSASWRGCTFSEYREGSWAMNERNCFGCPNRFECYTRKND